MPLLPDIKRPKEVAEFIGVKESTLANWRASGRVLRWSRNDIADWVDSVMSEERP